MSDLLTTLLLCFTAISLMGLAYLDYRNDRRRKEEKQRAIIETQQQTKDMVAAKLHDEYLSNLAAVRNKIKGMTGLEDYSEVLSFTIEGMRDLTKTLSSDYINLYGLINAIRTHLKLMPLESHLEVLGETRSTSNDIMIFAIIQELLTNILKHSGATKLEVKLNYSSKLQITITDNGINSKVPDTKGVGLLNIDHRLKMISGFIAWNKNVVTLEV